MCVAWEDCCVSHIVLIILEKTPGIESFVRKNDALLLYIDDALRTKDRRLCCHSLLWTFATSRRLCCYSLHLDGCAAILYISTALFEDQKLCCYSLLWTFATSQRLCRYSLHLNGCAAILHISNALFEDRRQCCDSGTRWETTSALLLLMLLLLYIASLAIYWWVHIF